MPGMSEDQIRSALDGRGLTPGQIQRILFNYEQAVTAQGADEWNTIDTQAWLDDQVAQYAGTDQPTLTADALGGVEARQDENARSFTAVQQMAREAAAQRRQDQQNTFFNKVRIDYGPAVDPDALANSLQSGAYQDANGNYIDPTTGEQVGADGAVPADPETLWHAIKGQRFNMGALAMPHVGPTSAQVHSPSYYPHGTAYRSGAVAHPSADTMARDPQRVGERYVTPAGAVPVRPSQFVTPSSALSLLSSMSPDYLTSLQLQMWEARLYPENSRPRWGEADSATREAFKALFLEAGLHPGQTIAGVLSDLAIDARDSTAPPEGSPGAGTTGMPTLVLPDFEPTIGNEEELRQQIDDIASETLGQFLSDDQRTALVKRLQDREVSTQRAQYDRDVSRAREQYAAQLGERSIGGGQQGVGATVNDVDAFLAALSGQESGGDYGATNAGTGAHGRYQIMPGNWPEWSRRAGLPPGSPQTPQNQEIVARQIVMDYYQQFGNWRDVAVAWYSGPGRVARNRYNDAPQSGGPSINDYANEVMGRMGSFRRGGVPGQPGSGPVIGGNQYAPIEQYDPVAEATAAMKAADPNAWKAMQFGDRATEFFGALGGVLGGR